MKAYSNCLFSDCLIRKLFQSMGQNLVGETLHAAVQYLLQMILGIAMFIYHVLVNILIEAMTADVLNVMIKETRIIGNTKSIKVIMALTMTMVAGTIGN